MSLVYKYHSSLPFNNPAKDKVAAVFQDDGEAGGR